MCFICNLVIDHKLSWFLIVLLGVLISFSITTISYLLKNNKYKVCKISLIITPLVYLLLFTINYVNNRDWLIESFIIASFVFVFLWMSILICTFTKIALNYKISISLFILAILTIFTNQFSASVLDINNNGANIPNIICAVILILIAIYLTLKQIFNKRD